MTTTQSQTTQSQTPQSQTTQSQTPQPEIWLRLESGDDWGHPFYYLEGQRDEKRRARGPLVRVRWPDGTASLQRVEVKRESHTVQDHGKPYSSSTEVQYLHVDVNGVDVSIGLDKVEVCAEDLEEVP